MAGELEERAVKGAILRKGPIITENLDKAFKEAKDARNDPAKLLENAGVTSSGIKKFTPTKSRSTAAFLVPRGTGFSEPRTAQIDRVFDTPHNPFRNRVAVETPQNLVELHNRFRYYFQREPIVGTALELHSEFPMSTFELNHDDPALMEDFNDIAESIELFQLALFMALEYQVVGECFPLGIFDDPDDPSVWKAFILLNPLNIDIQSVPITDGRPREAFKLKIDEATKKIVANGPMNKETGTLYNRIPADTIEACRGTGYLDLNPIQVSHFKRRGNYFKVRGESIQMRVIHLLNYKDKLREGQYNIIDRHITPREVWKIGEPGNPASMDELEAFSSMLTSSYLDPSAAIVWHHALAVEILGASEKLLPITSEIEKVDDEMLTGLYLNKGFLDSNYGAYANMSVALDVLISRYLLFRQEMEIWMREHVWAPICRIHNIYKPTQAELEHRIRVKNKDKRPWTPTVHWTKHELRDTTQKINLMMQIREKLGKPGFPKDLIYQAANYNPRTIERLLAREAKRDVINKPVELKGPGGPAGIPDLGIDLGGGPAGGAGAGEPALEKPIGEIPGGKGNLPETTPATNVNLNQTVQPPESQAGGMGNTGAPGR